MYHTHTAVQYYIRTSYTYNIISIPTAMCVCMDVTRVVLKFQFVVFILGCSVAAEIRYTSYVRHNSTAFSERHSRLPLRMYSWNFTQL